MTTQAREPLALPDVTWGYTPETGQLMATCGEHAAVIRRDPKNGQPITGSRSSTSSFETASTPTAGPRRRTCAGGKASPRRSVC